MCIVQMHSRIYCTLSFINIFIIIHIFMFIHNHKYHLKNAYKVYGPEAAKGIQYNIEMYFFYYRINVILNK